MWKLHHDPFGFNIIMLGFIGALWMRRVLLEGPIYRSWFLGEQVWNWWVGPDNRCVPRLPPSTMTFAKTIRGRDLELSLAGFSCEMFLEPFEEHAYFRFIQTHLLHIVPDSVYPIGPSTILSEIHSTTSEVFFIIILLFCLLQLFLIQVYRSIREVARSLVLRERLHFTDIVLMSFLGISLEKWI